MKKIFLIILVFTLYTNFAKAQNSLPVQYLELTKKILSNIKKSGESALAPKPATVVNNNTENAVSSSNLLDFAKGLLGIPYRYATSNPHIGFDCSGFVNYVYSNFGFKVPRSSREFSSIGKEITLDNAQAGDILIFTGSNPKIRRVGHVGIVYSISEDGMQFIHAASGKAKKVTITELDSYYRSRFIKIVRLL